MTSNERIAVFKSENRANIPVYPLDIFTLTDRGIAQIQGGATDLPADALVLLVLIDGKATVGDIEQKARPIAPNAVRELLRSLVSTGLVRLATIEQTDRLDLTAYFEAARRLPGPSGGATASADREAAAGEPQLKREGYYVSIARQAVTAKKPVPGARLSVLIVEDDADMANLVVRLLGSEGFDVDIAADREAILARLRRPPVPDAIILDIMLPDVNGFDVLQRVKTHPVLKSVPVIMLTADARRASVVRALVCGADGYISKPFERGKLVEGVKAILGLAGQDDRPA